jgi:UDP-N-acetylmuramoyl-L-alanyl-D-glutamate--2,6-diaminopimelate ligase
MLNALHNVPVRVKHQWRVIEPGWRTIEAWISAARFGFPARRLRIVAVTGTDGKSTTCHLTAGVLRAAGLPVGILSTVAVEFPDGGYRLRSDLTTPQPRQLQALLRELVDAGASWVVLEVSSHGLALRRTAGVRFEVGVLTNITPDHLDFHHTMDGYTAAKMRVFGRGRSFAVLNADDPAPGRVRARRIVRFGLHDGDVRASDVRCDRRSSTFELSIDPWLGVVRLPLGGAVNVMNALAAASVGVALDIAPADIVAGLEAARPLPGRMEWLDRGQRFDVVVDFAQTPRALRCVFEALRVFVAGRIIAVVGASGGRTHDARPLIGRIVAEECDHVVLTDRYPNYEDPAEIIAGLEAGLRAAGAVPPRDYEIVMDRRAAIERALGLAEPGDVVAILGLGHFDHRMVAGRRVPWDDRLVTMRLLDELVR